MQQTVVAAEAHARSLTYGSFRFEGQAMIATGSPTRVQWLRCLEYLIYLEQRVQFWIGDLLNYGEGRWGGMYTEMIRHTGYDYDTLRNFKWVASGVPIAQRREGLSFAHHQQVARLTPTEQQLLLDRAEREGWTSRGVRQEAYRVMREAPQPHPGTGDPGLYHGDCREVLERLPDHSVDLLLTDPPYGMNYESPTRIVPFPHMANDDAEHAFTVLDDALGIAARKLKAGSHVYVFTAWRTYRQMLEVVANHFAFGTAIAWVKNNWGVGDLDGNYAYLHELILFAYSGRPHRGGHKDEPVLNFDRVASSALQHPTQKPVALLEYLIGVSSHEGATVLDPFMGSGSSCVAARNSRRRYIGVEIDQRWYELALQRLADPTAAD